MQMNEIGNLEQREQQYRQQASELLAKAEQFRSRAMALSAAANEVRNTIITSRH